jgi:hypothetical protein
MQFIDTDPLYKIVRVTGPQHNLLGLQLSHEPVAGDPEIEALDQATGKPGALIGREVAAQVMLGVAEASAELQRTYHVDKIQYVSTDTPPVTVYRQLALEILRRVHALGR